MKKSKKVILVAVGKAWKKFVSTSNIFDMKKYSMLEDSAYNAGCSIDEVLEACK